MHQPTVPAASILLAATVSLAGMAAGSSGCTSQTPPPRLIHEGPRVTVGLQTLPPGTLGAAHPATLSEDTLALVLGGVRVGMEQRLMQTLFGGDATPRPAFAAETLGTLAASVSRALAAAGTDDYVRFEARQPGKRGEERTEGILYVRDGAIVLAFTDLRAGPGPGPPKGKAGGGAPLTPVGPQLSLAFEPRGVEIPLDAAPPAGLGSAVYRPLAIDYRLLTKLARLDERAASSARPPDPAGAPTSATVPQDAEVEALKDLVIQKDLEIEALRREVEALRKRLPPSGTREGH